MTLVAFNKPYGVLSQFTSGDARPTLADYLPVPKVYPAGRLDHDSEGLLLLTDDGALQARIADPRHELEKRYWAQVEGVPDAAALARLAAGIALKDGLTRPARVRLVDASSIWPRVPPIRYRARIPTTWIELAIAEGRNRQVRRMTAAIGHPTLRLVRIAIGEWHLDALGLWFPGGWKKIG